MILQKSGDILLDVRGLSVEFASPRGAVRVIDKLSFDLRAGVIL